MLERAERLGMPIRRIELGNELYYAAPLVVTGVPHPGGLRAQGHALDRRDQGAASERPGRRGGLRLPAASGSDRRQDEWDRRVRKTLRGESALTFHAYWAASRTRASWGAKLAAALASPLRLLDSAALAMAFAGCRRGWSAWVTEWNLWHGAKYRGTWANGLADAALSARPPRASPR